jgi:hypothetical protein
LALLIRGTVGQLPDSLPPPSISRTCSASPEEQR